MNRQKRRWFLDISDTFTYYSCVFNTSHTVLRGLPNFYLKLVSITRNAIPIYLRPGWNTWHTNSLKDQVGLKRFGGKIDVSWTRVPWLVFKTKEYLVEVNACLLKGKQIVDCNAENEKWTLRSIKQGQKQKTLNLVRFINVIATKYFSSMYVSDSKIWILSCALLPIITSPSPPRGILVYFNNFQCLKSK